MQKKIDRKAPSLLFQDLTLIYKVVRDFYTKDIKRIIIDDQEAHDSLGKFLAEHVPGANQVLELHKGATPVFDEWGIELDIGRALLRKINLPSGGHLVIDQTEAMAVFDVNTGRYVGTGSAKETILRTNLEAVVEIVYHLRLRDIGGIIVIDFIDMDDEVDRQAVSRHLHQELLKDKSRTNVLAMSALGLVQMTRKRTHDSLGRRLTDECPYCDGSGRVPSVTTEAFDLLREVERHHLQTGRRNLRVRVRSDIKQWILEEIPEALNRVTQAYGLTIKLVDADLQIAQLQESAFEIV